MKNYFKILLVILSVSTVFWACSSNDDSGNGDGDGENQAPSTFIVAVSSTSTSGATINWTQATDDDGDIVTYTVNLDGSELATNLSTQNYTFSGLTNSTSYSGSVVASDGNGGTSTASFSITTDTETTPATLHLAFAEFDADNTDIMLSGSNVVIESNGLPNHTSPYWSNTTERSAVDPMGNTLVTPAAAENHPLFVEPTVTSYTQMAPGNIDDFNGSYSLTVSANPALASSSTSTGLGPIGIAISGSMIYNDEEGPNIPLDNAVGSLDYTAAHTGPQSYHYHLETKAWSNDDDKLIGIIADGFFIYGRKCNSTNDYPSDLDASGGHTSTTQHSDGASEYHYHIQNELYLNQYYILFPGDYQGTPSNIQ
ncbi:YHYH protein [Psychroserpens burtonensis]|uniref:YHYH protein n=1 Tax=Psychroserpens burtonensis TaxID=49278 RepID=UPI00164B2766|nr:YHYH protein [Psychroserpens burtonensis]